MKLTRASIYFILQRAEKFEWSIQGLGMLRLYLSPVYRLHVWSRAHRRPGVTMLHTHPWDFESTVLSGWIDNLVYEERPGAFPFTRQQIVCGPAGDASGPPEPVDLLCVKRHTIPPGMSYRQRGEEIHETEFADGTVTLIQRTFRQDTEHAYVYYPRGAEWVSAIPRLATTEEVVTIARRALFHWKDSL